MDDRIVPKNLCNYLYFEKFIKADQSELEMPYMEQLRFKLEEAEERQCVMNDYFKGLCLMENMMHWKLKKPDKYNEFRTRLVKFYARRYTHLFDESDCDAIGV